MTCDTSEYLIYKDATEFFFDNGDIEFVWDNILWVGTCQNPCGGPDDFDNVDRVLIHKDDAPNIVNDADSNEALSSHQHDDAVAQLYYAHYCYLHSENNGVWTVEPAGARGTLDISRSAQCDCYGDHPVTDWTVNTWTWILMGPDTANNPPPNYVWDDPPDKWPANAGVGGPPRRKPKLYKIVALPELGAAADKRKGFLVQRHNEKEPAFEAPITRPGPGDLRLHPGGTPSAASLVRAWMSYRKLDVGRRVRLA